MRNLSAIVESMKSQLPDMPAPTVDELYKLGVEMYPAHVRGKQERGEDIETEPIDLHAIKKLGPNAKDMSKQTARVSPASAPTGKFLEI